MACMSSTGGRAFLLQQHSSSLYVSGKGQGEEGTIVNTGQGFKNIEENAALRDVCGKQGKKVTPLEIHV